MPEAFEGMAARAVRAEAEERAVAQAFARCFATPDGVRVLACLEALTIGRRMGPEVSEAMLRHVEGQRALYVHIRALIDRGRTGTFIQQPE